MNQQTVADFLVIGSGIAGLFTAIRAAKHGRVLLATKGELLESNTWYAQGGVAAALGREDSPQVHFVDTLQAGAGLCLTDAVQVLVNDGPQRILDLIELGARFDRDQEGRLILGKEAAHSRNRIVHARGDATGAEIAELLAGHAQKTAGLTINTNWLALELLMQDAHCTGAMFLDRQSGAVITCRAKATVLATGGCGQVYRFTTNPSVATGDGFAMAYRAGARLMDMEFIQFHPTALAFEENPMPLVSEAVRGEGAILVTASGRRFMPDIHPWAELAPRNVVARAIFDVMQEERVYLDATSLGDKFPQRFPTIFRLCMERGVDPRRDLIPVAPAAHFIMGGVWADTEGRTSIPGLYACGEVSCTGVHGANRLASNSLLEGLVFAERVAQALPHTPEVGDRAITPQTPNTPQAGERPETAAVAHPAGVGYRLPANAEEEAWCREAAAEIGDIMWQYAGIVRSAAGLETALSRLAALRRKEAAGFLPICNMLDTAMLIATSAYERQESRGGHYRRDFPVEAAEWANRHVVVTREGCQVVQNGAVPHRPW